MGGRSSKFVANGGSRLHDSEIQRIATEVALEFAPLLADAGPVRRLVLRCRWWFETRQRIGALEQRHSRHINWLKP